jgi:hypothetical protein
LRTAETGFGRDGAWYSAHFFELAEQPVKVSMAVSENEAKALIGAIEKAGLQIFYVKIPVEFGVTGAHGR